MDRSFVRRAFYIAPPVNANEQEWSDWLRADERAATIDKRRFSRERNRNIDVEFVPSMSVAKINGRYKQVPSIGFVSMGDSTQLEPIFEARQEMEVEQAKAKLEAKSFRSHGKGNHVSKRQAIRDARKAKYRSR